jgi:uncharacterized protein (DUF433 family)
MTTDMGLLNFSRQPKSDENVILGFTAEQAAALSGLSERQLSAWARAGFFKPQMESPVSGAAFGRVYSFKDVVGLRVLAQLRKRHKVSLQQLRRVAAKLGGDPFQVWGETTLYVVKGQVVFEDESGRHRSIVDGQYVAGIPLERVIGEVKREANQLKHRKATDFGRIAKHRFVARSATTLAGTRIPTAAIKRFSDAGYSVDQILKEYPTLRKEDVEAALRHEAQNAA